MKTTASRLHLVSFLLFLLLIFPYPILSRRVQQPFQFLQNLEGSHKSQTVKGLNELKQYLKKFGYLSVNDRLTDQQENNDDEFDDLLESGIKTYQLNYHLDVTGVLDAQTVKQMMMPRCGFPDIKNGTTSMESGKMKNHGQTSSSLHTVSRYSFFPEKKKWPPSKTHLTYQFSSSAQAKVDIQTLRSVCSRAFATWAAVSGFTFLETSVAGQQADIVIGFHRGDHGDGAPFDGPGGVLAHSFPPTDGRFHYDADENWSSDPGPGMYDLESFALHEIGHLLGLGHSSVVNAIMYPAAASGVKKRELQEDDIQGIRALYPEVVCTCKFDDIVREWSFDI